MQRLECDVLVIGGGLAGVWAALRSRDLVGTVMLAEKGRTGRAGQSAFSGANLLCPLAGDDLAAWRKEIVERGEYMNDQDWVDVVLSEQELRVHDMERMGVEFERDSQGKIVRSVGLAHQVTRLATVNSLQMMARLRKNLELKGVNLLDRLMITHLLTSDGQCPTRGRVVGALGFDARSGEIFVIAAKATVVATGGAGHFDLSGDGICQSFRVGAEVTSMEFARCFDKMAFGKKCVEVHLNSFQRYGMILRNRQGERFMERYAPELKERGKRQTLGLAILCEHLAGKGPVYMDLTHLDRGDLEKLCDLPATTRNIRALQREGIDLRQGRAEINITSGFLRFLGGGIKHNLYCEAKVAGLYVAGEAGGYPAHGTYSVGGMNLAECCVEGYRAGEYAARFSKEVTVQLNETQARELSEEVRRPMSTTNGVRPDDIWYGLQEYISPAHVSVFRTSESIRAILGKIGELQKEKIQAVDVHELVKAHKAKNYLLSAEMIYTASLEREECRCCNIRADFPYRDDVNWLKWLILSWDGTAIKVRPEDIPMYRYPLKPEKPGKKPFDFPIPGRAALQLSSFLILVLALLAAVAAQACKATIPEGPVRVSEPSGPAATQRNAWDELVDAAKKEGAVMLYATELGAAKDSLKKAVKERFDIDVDATQGRPAEIVARLTAERRAGLYLSDIGLMGLSSFLGDIKPLGVAVPLPSLLVLPEVTDPAKWRNGKIPYLDKEGHSLAMVAQATPASIRNTDLVKEGEITSFLDYLQPKWKGKIVLSDPAVAGSANNYFALMATQIFGMERTVEILRQLAAQEPVMVRDQRMLLEWVAKGKYPVGIGQSSTQFAEFKRLGAPIDLVPLKEPPFVTSGAGNVFVFDKAPHPNAAKLFVNWLLTKEGASLWSPATGYPSMRLDVSVEGLNPLTILPPGATIPDEAQLRAQAEMRKIAEGIFAPLTK